MTVVNKTSNFNKKNTTLVKERCFNHFFSPKMRLLTALLTVSDHFVDNDDSSFHFYYSFRVLSTYYTKRGKYSLIDLHAMTPSGPNKTLVFLRATTTLKIAKGKRQNKTTTK